MYFSDLLIIWLISWISKCLEVLIFWISVFFEVVIFWISNFLKYWFFEFLNFWIFWIWDFLHFKTLNCFFFKIKKTSVKCQSLHDLTANCVCFLSFGQSPNHARREHEKPRAELEKHGRPILSCWRNWQFVLLVSSTCKLFMPNLLHTLLWNRVFCSPSD